MSQSHTQKSFNQKMSLLSDIICQKSTILDSSKKYEKSTYLIKQWLKDIFKEDVHKLQYGGEIMIKDKNHLYQNFNEVAVLLGSKGHAKPGISDLDITPEYAEKYISNGQNALESKSKFQSIEMGYHEIFGWVDYDASIYPILDDNGDAQSTVVICNAIPSLAKLSFASVARALINGYGRLLIKKSFYTCTLLGNTIKFSAREVECLIYLLLGMENKIIARHMKLSPKTIEKMVTLMNSRVGVMSSSGLIQKLEAHDFFINL